MTGPFYSNADKNSSPKRCLCPKKSVATFEMCSVGSDLCNRVVIGMCGKRAADLDPGPQGRLGQAFAAAANGPHAIQVPKNTKLATIFHNLIRSLFGQMDSTTLMQC